MKQFINKFRKSIVGVASGFDRIVFHGLVRPLMFPEGAMAFLGRRRILYKDARAWVVDQTKDLIASVEQYSLENCGQPIAYIRSTKTRKEDLARERQAEMGTTTGLIGTWSCVEAGRSYRLAFGEGAPTLRPVQTRCKHLYSYFDHPEYGFMHVRMQTWFPYKIQIAMNGREWLVRQLESAGISCLRRDNKILHVDDFEAMSRLLAQQLRTNWCSLLDRFVPIAFPTMTATLGTELRYSWYLWQSEWASDVIFKDRRVLDDLMMSVVRSAFIGGHPSRLLRYFGRPVRKDGQPRRDCSTSMSTRVSEHDEGFCAKHWLGRNSVKIYNAHNVLRFETTINDPGDLRGVRRKQGAPPTAKKELRPLRKSVADTTLRARACQDVNDRIADHVAAAACSESFGNILESVTSRKRRRRRSVRGLDPTGKDLALLSVIADPAFALAGFRNRDLRTALAGEKRFRNKTEKQRSGMTTRSLRLLRDHGIIRRLPKAHLYRLTTKGRKLTNALQAALAASTEELTAIAA